MSRNVDMQAVVSETELAQRREREARQQLRDALLALRRTAQERDRWRALALAAAREARHQALQPDDADREDEA